MAAALVGAGHVGAVAVPAGPLPPQLFALVDVHAAADLSSFRAFERVFSLGHSISHLRVHPEPRVAGALVARAPRRRRRVVNADLVAAAVALEAGVVRAAGLPVVLQLVPLGTEAKHLKRAYLVFCFSICPKIDLELGMERNFDLVS